MPEKNMEKYFFLPFFADNAPGEGEKIQDSYERLVVRAHGFDKSVTLFREELFQRLCSQIEDIDTKSVAAASVWLNGEYYNFEWLQEVYDDRYMEENYGLIQPGDSYRKVKLRDDKIREDVDADERIIRRMQIMSIWQNMQSRIWRMTGSLKNSKNWSMWKI